MTYSAVSVLLEWAKKATIEQQQEMAKRIEKLDPSLNITSYEINEVANAIKLAKI